MVVDPNGPPCPCGKRGLLGAVRVRHAASAAWRATPPAAVGSTRPWRWPAATPKRCAASTSPRRPAPATRESQAVLDALAHWIALGLANLVNVLDPAIIVIGGGLVEAADLLLPEVRARFAALVMAGEQRPIVPIVPAALGRAGRRDRGRPPRPLPGLAEDGLGCAYRTLVSPFRGRPTAELTGGTVSRTLRRAIAALSILVLTASGVRQLRR